MATPIIALSLQLATILAPEAIALYRAIVALKAKGVSAADVTALVTQLEANIGSLDADTLATLALLDKP